MPSRAQLPYNLILIFSGTMGICFLFLTPHVEESKGGPVHAGGSAVKSQADALGLLNSERLLTIAGRHKETRSYR